MYKEKRFKLTHDPGGCKIQIAPCQHLVRVSWLCHNITASTDTEGSAFGKEKPHDVRGNEAREAGLVE